MTALVSLLGGCLVRANAEPDQQALIRAYSWPRQGVWLEIIRADSPESHLSRQKDGLHHLCFEVESLEAAFQELRGEVMPFQAPMPSETWRGRRTAWVMSQQGLLIELLEE